MRKKVRIPLRIRLAIGSRTSYWDAKEGKTKYAIVERIYKLRHSLGSFPLVAVCRKEV